MDASLILGGVIVRNSVFPVGDEVVGGRGWNGVGILHMVARIIDVVRVGIFYRLCQLLLILLEGPLFVKVRLFITRVC